MPRQTSRQGTPALRRPRGCTPPPCRRRSTGRRRSATRHRPASRRRRRHAVPPQHERRTAACVGPDREGLGRAGTAPASLPGRPGEPSRSQPSSGRQPPGAGKTSPGRCSGGNGRQLAEDLDNINLVGHAVEKDPAGTGSISAAAFAGRPSQWSGSISACRSAATHRLLGPHLQAGCRGGATNSACTGTTSITHECPLSPLPR